MNVKKILNIVILFSIIFFILYLNIRILLPIINLDLPYSLFSKYFSFFAIIFLILYVFYKIVNKELFKIKDILIIILSIFSFLSYLFAFNKNIALFGFINRYEGLLVILTYYILFLLASTLNDKHKKIVFTFIISIGVFQVLLGTIQFLRITNILGYDRSESISSYYKYASGTFGNPNFYSTYILMCLTYIFNKLRLKENFTLNLILFVFFLYGLIIGNTLSGIFSFLIIFIMWIIKIVNKKNIKKIIILVVSIVTLLSIVFALTDNFFNTKFNKTINRNIKEIETILTGGVTDETGKGRIAVWKYTISRVPEYLLTGIGIDNFACINGPLSFCTPYKGQWLCYDKVHNEYLQKLITEGIFSFMFYILLLCYVLYNGKKNKSIYLNIVVAYLIQAIFNISVIEVAPIFYISMGFLLNKQQ